MNHATTAQATKNETTNPIARTIHCWPVIFPGEKTSAAAMPVCVTAVPGRSAFRSAYPVATNIVGIDRKNENSSADARVIPAICPAAIVDIDRDVPGNTAERIWH